MPFPNDDEEKPKPAGSSSVSSETDKFAGGTPKEAVGASGPLATVKQWLSTILIPTPISLGAIVLAAFLLLPAIKGLISTGSIRQLEQSNSGLDRQLTELRSESIRLQRELSEREVRLSQRASVQQVVRAGIFVSPLLSLQAQKTRVPDLITIDFSQTEEAILVFSLPNQALEEIEMNVYQEGRLLWNQTIAIPADRLLSQNLVSFLLTRPNFGPGTYRLKVEGNPGGQRVELNEFDLTING